MGKPKPKYLKPESEIRTGHPWEETQRIPLQAKLAEFSVNYKIPKKLLALMEDDDFVFQTKASCFLYRIDMLRHKRKPNKSEMMAAVDQIGQGTSDLHNCLLELDHVTTRFMYEAAASLEKVLMPVDFLPRESLTLFEHLLSDLELLLEVACRTKKLLENNDYSHKDYSAISLAIHIKHNLIKRGVKPTIYRSGIWCILLMIALACENVYIDQETAFNVLREATKTEPEYYGEVLVNNWDNWCKNPASQGQDK